MQIQTITALFMLLALCFIASVAAEVFIDDFVRTHSLFASLLMGTLLTGISALIINIDIP